MSERRIFNGTTERRLKIIRTLSQRRHETIPNLAFEFSVTERTILRDIDEISDIIPIYCKQGRYEGGVYVDKDYSMDKAYMSKEEVALLRKIIIFLKDNQVGFLNVEEENMFEQIINDYSIPTLKY